MMTYLYSYLMDIVDSGDQRSTSFSMQSTHVKSWNAVFCSLTNIIVVNAFLLSFALRSSLRYPEIDELKIRSGMVLTIGLTCFLTYLSL